METTCTFKHAEDKSNVTAKNIKNHESVEQIAND